MRVLFFATLLSVGLLIPAEQALARQPQPAFNAEPAHQLEEIVVTARRADMPIWEVSDGETTVILAGAIAGLPRGYEWRAEALEEATRRSDRILYPTQARASAADMLRLIWRIRSIGFLPEGRTTDHYLSPELQARLDAVMASERNDRWRRQSLVVLGLDLMEKAGAETRGGGAVDVVRRAARSGRIPGAPVGVVRGDGLVENLISAPPETYLACMERAVTAAEAGAGNAAQRLEDWRRRRVPAVMANPLDQAMGLCWPSGDPDVSPRLRADWATAIEGALGQPGVTLGVAPLRLLAEPGGVLDQLEARGLEIIGPDWRADQETV